MTELTLILNGISRSIPCVFIFVPLTSQSAFQFNFLLKFNNLFNFLPFFSSSSLIQVSTCLDNWTNWIRNLKIHKIPHQSLQYHPINICWHYDSCNLPIRWFQRWFNTFHPDYSWLRRRHIEKYLNKNVFI